MRTSLILLMVFGGIASAATYYVDFATGNDANNGTSTSTPFQHCPGDTNCTDTADSTTLSAGDIVKFKGGIAYAGNVSIAWSGTSGNNIIYDGNHTGDWGTGRAVIDNNYTLNGACLYASAGRSFITVQGFELRNAAGYADDSAAVTNAAAGTVTNTVNTGGYGVYFFSGNHTNLYFDNLYIHRVGGWRNTQGWQSTTINGTGISIRSPQSITITNCEMTKMKAAIGIYAASATGTANDVEIVGCNIHNYIGWGVDVSPLGNGAVLHDIRIHDNEIHDYAEFTAGNWQGVGEGPHTDGIFIRKTDFDSAFTNVTVFNNNFYCDDPGDSLGGTASIFIENGPSVLVYNNLFNSDPHTRSIGVANWNAGSEVQFVRIYNNTFISSAACIILSTETNALLRRVFIQNNIFRKPAGSAQNNTMVTRLTGVNPEVMDNNLYYDPGWTESTKETHAWPGPTWIFFDEVFNTIGFEENGIYADPLFLSFVATPSDCNLGLQSGSPAIGAGTNLSAYFTTDKSGVARGSTWDIGAFEFQPSRIWNVGTVNAVNVNVGGSQ